MSHVVRRQTNKKKTLADSIYVRIFQTPRNTRSQHGRKKCKPLIRGAAYIRMEYITAVDIVSVSYSYSFLLVSRDCRLEVVEGEVVVWDERG